MTADLDLRAARRRIWLQADSPRTIRLLPREKDGGEPVDATAFTLEVAGTPQPVEPVVTDPEVGERRFTFTPEHSAQVAAAKAATWALRHADAGVVATGPLVATTDGTIAGVDDAVLEVVAGDATWVLELAPILGTVSAGEVDLSAHDADPAAHPPLRLRLNGVEHPGTFASGAAIELEVSGAPLVAAGTGEWDAVQIQEPGAPVWDPDNGAWMLPYAGVGEETPGGPWVTRLGALISTDGETWTAHPDNPISGTHPGDDPYLARNPDGTLYRDSAGRALMFCEERPSGHHRGVELWRSGAGVLDDWSLVGRVLDRGEPGSWDSADRTSPTVVSDGDGTLVMLFEGRSDINAEDGQVGVAWSTDEGETWTVAAEPVIAGVGPWGVGVVPDDVVRVGDAWVLVGHTYDGTSWQHICRFVTLDAPAEWGPGSFEPMAGNPVTTSTDTLMFRDESNGVWISGDALHPVRVVSGGGEVDLSEVEGRLDAVEQQAAGHGGRLDALEARRWIDGSGAGADAQALVMAALHKEHLDTGSVVDAAVFGPPNVPFGEGSNLDLSGPLEFVLDWTEPGDVSTAVILLPATPAGALTAGVLLEGVELGGVAIDSITAVDAETFAPVDVLFWPGLDVVVLADPAVLAAGELGVSGRAVALTFTAASEDPPERVTIEKVHVLLKPALS